LELLPMWLLQGPKRNFSPRWMRGGRSGDLGFTFYFCDRPSNFTNEQQIEQKGRVIRFRNELNSMGVVRKFSSVDDFENTLFQDLLKIIPRLLNARGQTKQTS